MTADTPGVPTAPVDAPPAAATPIEQLMTDAMDGGAAPPRQRHRHAPTAGNIAPPEIDAEVGPDELLAGDHRSEPRRRPIRTDRLLQTLLIVNLALIGIVIALPMQSTTAPPTVPEHAGTTGTSAVEPFLSPPRQLGHLPTHELWQSSVTAAGEGNYTAAVALLERYAQTEGMSELERQLVYNQLAYYLVKDGKLDAAREYTLKAQQLLTRAYLPEDLLAGAERAEAAGASTAMRSAYARFLLQLRQASPELRRREAEAYLKLGDSYRLEAQREPTAPATTSPDAVPVPAKTPAATPNEHAPGGQAKKDGHE